MSFTLCKLPSANYLSQIAMTSDQPSAAQPSAAQPSAAQPSSDQPSAAQPAEQPAFGWTSYAEIINGRFAMIGFVALLILELFTHQDFFTWLGLR
jgi:Chlorophyll A-B binding protein